MIAGRGLPRWVEAPLAAVGLVVSLPLMAIGGAAMSLTSPGPMIFRQHRMGKGGVPFTMYKLRSMTAASAGPSVTAAGDSRITAVGRVLRRLKIDELPELWNVVAGDMSLVGPRPEVPHLVNLDDPLWIEALQCAPGITDPVTLKLRDEEGLLRAAGREGQHFYESSLQPFKLRGYLAYQQGRTWRTDIAVVLRTLAAVVRWPGAIPEQADILREITGSQHAAAKPLS